MSLFRPVLFASSALVGLAALYIYRPRTPSVLTPHPVFAWTSREPRLRINLKVEINAPAAVVFDHLIRPTTYSTWNSFVPHPLQNGHDPAELQRAIVLGDELTLNCIMPHLDSAKAPENVTTKFRVVLIQPPTDGAAPEVYYVQWVDSMLPDWLLRSSRLHTITATAQDACVYESDMRFYGPLSWLVKWRSGERVRLGSKVGWMEGMKAGMERYMEERTVGK